MTATPLTNLFLRAPDITHVAPLTASTPPGRPKRPCTPAKRTPLAWPCGVTWSAPPVRPAAQSTAFSLRYTRTPTTPLR
uniref:Nuclear protein UL55 n=1 Tax=Human herpesvirus 1 TaxID=10298 RepID=A0A0F7CWU7_HHV1|nr:nuclear protein UL55 [Human alphaherpesvirus 1]AKG59528.1 nuclear protein UL55 [Human alphaherpesvirus 1]AKG59965.1 nuclear protein UL55 [Human alphaherpesvirus 1]AKG61840.1 nuclear protein UL55 [Human alphaherpesvirus 1]ANN84107.1 nuclear protein UL55 [Human alphaherpesvirus 1]